MCIADEGEAVCGDVPMAALECVCEYMEVMLLRTHCKLLGLECPSDAEHKPSKRTEQTDSLEHQADAVAMAWKLVGHGLLPQLIAWCVLV